MPRRDVREPHAAPDGDSAIKASPEWSECRDHPERGCQPGNHCDDSKVDKPPQPWKPLFFNNDFGYKKEPCHTPLCGECLKDMPLECCGLFEGGDGLRMSFGGELRHRYMNEENRLRLGGPARSTYDLWRWRNYIDVRASDWLRGYMEMLDASIFNEDLPPTPIDLNRWNIQNAFFDLKLSEREGQPVYFRFGRQELLYGAQRLISPLDWSNTRRNFQGFNVTSRGETWDIDAFATRPVNTATGNLPLSRFDHERDKADASRTFSGVYATYHGIEANTLDLYWLWLREQEPIPGLADGSRHTVGARWAGTRAVKEQCCTVVREWSWDVEGAYQFGHDNDATGAERTVQAGFVTANLAHAWTSSAWKPKLAAVYYWGSGDRDRADDENNTFSVLFPLGHTYWGYIDNVAGQNLIDYSVAAYVSPTDKLTFQAAMHWFELDSDGDVLYNVAGAPVGTPGTGKEVGEELDLVATYVFNPNFNVQVGYLWFWNGTFIDNNVPRDKATQLYVQTILRY